MVLHQRARGLPAAPPVAGAPSIVQMTMDVTSNVGHDLNWGQPITAGNTIVVCITESQDFAIRDIVQANDNQGQNYTRVNHWTAGGGNDMQCWLYEQINSLGGVTYSEIRFDSATDNNGRVLGFEITPATLEGFGSRASEFDHPYVHDDPPGYTSIGPGLGFTMHVTVASSPANAAPSGWTDQYTDNQHRFMTREEPVQFVNEQAPFTRETHTWLNTGGIAVYVTT